MLSFRLLKYSMQLMRRSVLLSVTLLFCAQIGYANATSPSAPTNVVAERTSDSTVRITWSPSTDDVGVVGYNVYRDDKYISTVTNPRLGDIQLAPDVVYTYYVVAFDEPRNFSPRSHTASTGGASTQQSGTQESATQQAGSISVDGGRISWPDDGWYQVQDVPNYTEQCAGTRFCDVQAGQYLVVNHTTGERFPIVSVGQHNNDTSTESENNSSVGTDIRVDGNLIYWFGDDWYQVQDATTFKALCSGTGSCEVPQGDYIVINHTTGVRTTITVEGSDILPIGNFINAGNALELWANLVPVINEEALIAFFDDMAGAVTTEGTIADPNRITFSENIRIDPPYQFTGTEGSNFDVFDQQVNTCVNGGRVLGYSSDSIIPNFAFQGLGVLGYDNVFERCAVGEYEYRGTIGARGALGRNTIDDYEFTDFQIVSSDGTVRTLNGNNTKGNPSRAIVDYTYDWRNVNFTDSASNLTIINYVMDRAEFNGRSFSGETDTVNGMVIAVNDYGVRSTIAGRFTVEAPFTEGLSVFAEVDLTFNDRVREAANDPNLDFPTRDPLKPFSWQPNSFVLLIASDGSRVTVRAADNNQFTLEFDNGETMGPYDWTGRFAIDKLTFPPGR